MFRSFVQRFFHSAIWDTATCVQLLPSWQCVSGGSHNQSPVQWQGWECDCTATVFWHDVSWRLFSAAQMPWHRDEKEIKCDEMRAEVRDANERWDHTGDANEMRMRRASDHENREMRPGADENKRDAEVKWHQLSMRCGAETLHMKAEMRWDADETKQDEVKDAGLYHLTSVIG